MAKLSSAVILLASVAYATALLIPPPNIPTSLSTVFSRMVNTENDPRCHSNGIFPDPSDCTSYIACLDGNSQVRKCPEGFKYDSRKHCTPEGEEADCGVPQHSEPDCPAMFGMFRNPENCREYILCDERVATLRRCPEGHVFEQNVGCVEGDACKEPSLQFSEIGTEETLPPPLDTVNIRCYSNELKPYPGDCGRYVECTNGKPMVRLCPEGLHFSKKSERCETPCKAKCDADIPCEVESARRGYNDVSFKCPQPKGKFPDPFDCQIYYECKDSVPEVHTCWFGRYFDKKSKKCTSANKAKCTYRCSKANGKYAYPKDCDRYIRCIQGKPRVKRCPEDQSFDFKKLECLPKGEARCETNDIRDIFQDD